MIAPVDVTNVRIETDRLILRGWRKSDLEDFYAYARVDGVGQMAGWLPHGSIDESRKILDLFIEGKKTLALELKESGRVIGSLGLEEREYADLPMELLGREIGYVLSKDFWGRGLMPEAVKAVSDYCFRELNYDYLLCGHFLSNHQSKRVIEKCGFQFQKEILHKTRMGTEECTKLYLLENVGKIIGKMSAPVDAATILLETERLVLRPILSHDLADIHEMLSQKEVARMAGWQVSENLEMSKCRLQEYIKDNETLAVVLKSKGKVIGTVSLQKRYWNHYPIDRNLKGREFGFDLNQQYWGMGLMPEAVKAVCEYCFTELCFDFLTAGYFLDNFRSARVIEKCGFRFLYEGEHVLPGDRTFRIRTFIQYNPNKE